MRHRSLSISQQDKVLLYGKEQIATVAICLRTLAESHARSRLRPWLVRTEIGALGITRFRRNL